MNVPEGLLYSKTDEWLRQDGEDATIGITDYAQHELGEIVYVELPEVGSNLTAGQPFGVVESVKAVSELVSPVGGTVIDANQPVSDDPSIINNSAFEQGWLVKVKVADQKPLDDLLDAAAYAAYRGG